MKRAKRTPADVLNEALTRRSPMIQPSCENFDVALYPENGGWGYVLSRGFARGPGISPAPGDKMQTWRVDWRPWWTRQDALKASKRAADAIPISTAASRAAEILKT